MVSSSGSSFPRHWAWSQGSLSCAAPVWSGDAKATLRLRSAAAAQGHGIRTKRRRARSRGDLSALKLNSVDLFAGPSSQRQREERRYFAIARTSRCPPGRPEHRRARGPHPQRLFPAVKQTRANALARRKLRTRECEGETTAFEWSFPRGGAGAKPPALIVTLDTLASSRVLKRNCLRGSRRNRHYTTSVGGISSPWKSWGGAVPCCAAFSSGPDPAIARQNDSPARRARVRPALRGTSRS